MYLSVPHPAGDPVMAANKDRVLEFLRTTFFDNAAALECRLAEMCSTLRGVTIVRAFIVLQLDAAMGPGGVGLNTCLIANLFGGNHGFMDMNVLKTWDELRKQVESGPPCVPQVVTTGSAETFARR